MFLFNPFGYRLHGKDSHFDSYSFNGLEPTTRSPLRFKSANNYRKLSIKNHVKPTLEEVFVLFSPGVFVCPKKIANGS